MRNFILCTCFIFSLATNMYAKEKQNPPSKFDQERKAKGYLRIDPVTLVTTARQLVADQTRTKLGQGEQLILQDTEQDQLGNTHTRYQQYHKGIRVEGATYIVHEKANKVHAANGGLIRSLQINTQPSISKKQAEQIAQLHTAARQVSSNLIIFAPTFGRDANNYHLTYAINLAEKNTRIYVDAHTGEVLGTTGHCQHIDVPGTGIGGYNGLVDITIDDQNTRYVLKDNTRNIHVFDYSGATPDSLFTDTDTHFEAAPNAVDAYWALQKTYDYYFNDFGRNSYNNQGGPVTVWVNFNQPIAAWIPSVDRIYLGIGDNVTRSSATSLEIVAHEFTHGVIQYLSNFSHSDVSEAGALSEAFPDMFGVVMEHLHHPNGGNWIIGDEYVIESGKNGLRNLANPQDPTMTLQMIDFYDPNNLSDNKYINAGIPNHWFYLLAEGNPNSIGITKAAQIAYHSLFYMASNAMFEDARIATITAAEDLFGINSNEAEQTATAWNAVGVENDGQIIATCRQRDSLALVAIYETTGGTTWTNTWDLTQPIDTWHGVSLNPEGCLRILNLNENQLSGDIPAEIGNLNDIQYLYLRDNQITSIPAEISSLHKLINFNLIGNQLSELPTEIGNLINLETLHLGGNQLIGMPSEIASLIKLTQLTLSQNQLSALPAQIGNLTNLTILNLKNNQLSELPSEIGNLSKLEYLHASENHLSTLPPTIGNLTNLIQLTIQKNQLSDIPSEIGNLSNLELFNTSINQLDKLPVELENLNNLNELNVHTNRLNFGQIQSLTDNAIAAFYYAPQDTILTFRDNNKLYVDAGGTVSENTYNWYKDGILIQTITGNNIYTPDTEGAYYCVASNALVTIPGNGTNLILTSHPLYFSSDSSSVYPGDYDLNGVVEVNDMLYWGLAYGNQGPIRENASTAWGGQVCPDWQTNINGINGKHQDGNGDGIINDDDLDIISLNYAKVHPVDSVLSPTLPPDDYVLKYVLIADSISNEGDLRYTTYDVLIETRNVQPVSLHGLVFDMDYLGIDPSATMTANISNSSFGTVSDVGFLEIFDATNQRLSTGISLKNIPDVIIDGSATQILIIEQILQGGEDFTSTIQTNNGSLIKSDSTTHPIAGQTLYTNSPNPNGLEPTVMASVAVTHPSCDYLGAAEVQVINDASCTYLWSTGDSTAIIRELAPGSYTVTVSEAGHIPALIEVEVEAPFDCPNAINVAATAYLGGAYDPDTGLMRDGLRNLGIIPLTDPYSRIYTISPTVLDVTGNSAIVDWVEVELRAADQPERTVFRRSALIRRDGKIVDVDGISPLKLVPIGLSDYYLVIKHRNHFPIMSSVLTNTSQLNIDFSITNSHTTLVGEGQQEVQQGVWAMLPADINADGDINGADKGIWSAQNGTFGIYTNTDVDLDGDVNGGDKIIWGKYNGKFSGTP